MPDTTLDDRVRRLLLAEHFDDRTRQKLRDLGDVALEGLRACARGSDRGEAAVLKARAIVALGDWPEEEAVDTLADAISDRRLETRMRAATALGDVATDRAVSVLADRAERCDDGVELAAIARSLARIDRSVADEALGRVRASIASDDVRRQVDLALDERSAD